jgi:hypothetical protein
MRRNEDGWSGGRRWFGAAALAVAVWALSTTPGVTDEERPKSGDSAPDLALVRQWRASFVSVRVADLLASGYLNALPPTLKENLDRAMTDGAQAVGIPAANFERLTVVMSVMRGGLPVFVARTTKPYDSEKLAASLVPEATARKQGDLTVYSTDRAFVSLAVIDDHDFAIGGRRQLADLLNPAAKMPAVPEGAAELLFGKHLIAAGINPIEVIEQFPSHEVTSQKSPASRSATPRMEKRPIAPPGEKKASPQIEKKSSSLPGSPSLLPLLAVAAMADEPVSADALADLPLEALPLKPFLQARYIALALDGGDSIKLEGRVFYRDADDARDGEAAVRMALYLIREAPAVILRNNRDLSAESAPKLHAALKALALAQRQATVERRDTEVQFRMELPVDAKLALGVVRELNRVSARTQSQNNLRQIGLAMHNFHATYNGFPGGAICDAKGKPLLSWRVAILPFIEEGRLYNEFKMDEPWDSEHNKKLIARMPKTYSVPADPSVAKHETYYRAFTGKEALFHTANRTNGPISIGPRITEILDGTSNTIMVAEAAESVPWTKPDELAYDSDKPLPKLGGLFKGGFHALFADASVRFIRSDISEKTLRALITPAGGETIGYSEFEQKRPAPPAAPERSPR